jgi:hypothetical protein
MRNVLFGAVGVLIGLALLIGGLTAGPAHHAGGAYGSGASAGETARIPVAVLFLLAGLWALRKGIQRRGH